MKTCFFTIVDDRVYYPGGTHIMINSFKRFHPDIDLVVFRQDMIDKVFKEKNINFYQAKPTFAKLLTDKYDLVVNIDCDHVITGRLDEILKGDYDVGGPWNFNDYENASFENITEEMYLQAGIVASTKKKFWDTWEKANKKAMKYLRKENDILNLVIYNQMPKVKLKIFDKEKNYYGCKSLGREPEFYIEDAKLMCRGEQILAYHFARGNVMPKLNFDTMPLKDEVKTWLKNIGYYGQSVTIGGL
jgi:hypothetical protein